MQHFLIYIITYLPLFALILIQISGLDPIISIFQRKSVNNESFIPFVAIFLNCSIWVSYGYLLQDPIIFASNSIGSLFGFSYLWIYYGFTMDRALRSKILKLFSLTLFLIIIVTIILPYSLWITQINAITIIGIVGDLTSIGMRSSPLIAINSVIKYKSTRYLSLFMSFSMTLHGFSWVLYGVFIQNKNIFIILPNSLGFVAGLIQLFLFIIYRHDKTEELLSPKSSPPHLDIDNVSIHVEDTVVSVSTEV